MTVSEAKEKLSFHSLGQIDIENPRWKNGFLGSLRPYSGTPPVEAFHDVIACLKVLSNHFRDSENLEKSLVRDVSAIIHYGRACAVWETGMLRRNNLSAEADWKAIEKWVECISYIFTCLLDGTDDETAFEPYTYEYGKR